MYLDRFIVTLVLQFMHVDPDFLVQMTEPKFRGVARTLMNQVAHHQHALTQYAEIVTSRDQVLAANDQLVGSKEQRTMRLTHEMAALKRWKLGRSFEGLNAEQLKQLMRPSRPILLGSK